MVSFSWAVTSARRRGHCKTLTSKTTLAPVLLVLLTFLWTESHSASSSSSSPIVTTKYGPLKGVRLQFSSSSARHLDPVTAYLGIPYASPPINAYRFMPPVAPLPWRETRPATTPPPACPQRFPDISNRTRALETMTERRYLFLSKLIPHLANQSEDCLYLNFYVPTSPPEDSRRDARYPIVLVIHGESWEWGSGNEFDGAALASIGNHIVVTFNYRLGPLGFLKTSNQQSNFGLLDVIAALHWVKESADSFSGDKNRITLLGYRTGAVIANLLLVAQIAKGLFQRAILISGSVLSPWALQRRPEDVAKELSTALGCVGKLPLSHPESDLAPCLRKKHVSELISFVPSSPKFLSAYAPYVDNVLLNNPKTLMESGGQSSSSSSSSSQHFVQDQFLRAELLILFTTSEGVHELNDHELRAGFESDHRDKILRTLVRNVFNYHQQEILSIVRNEYTDWERPILHPIPLRDSTVEALSDCVAIGPCLQVAGIHAKRGAKTWVMHFSHVSKDSGGAGEESAGFERLGSLEGDIVPYVMGLPVTNNIPALGLNQHISPFAALANFSKQDAFVAEMLLHYVANFVKSGDPNLNEATALGLSSSSHNGDPDHHSPSDDWVVLGPNSREQRDQRRRIQAPQPWESYEPVGQVYLSLGAKPRLRNHYRGHKMALWLNLIPQIHLPGGTDVTLNHHAFPDDNPNLYIGQVRPLSAYSLGEQGQSPGFGILVAQPQPGGPQTASPGASLTTTECLESTESPLSQGTRHSVLRIDSNEVEVEIRGGGGESVVPLSSSPGMRGTNEYDFTTALTVTITVGVALIALNLVVFSAIMCQRKRAIPTNNEGGGGGRGIDEVDESGRSSGGGTPQKGGVSQYQLAQEWSTACCSSSNHNPNHPQQQQQHHPNDFPTTHLSSSSVYMPAESISMSQYHQQQQHHFHHGNSGGGTLPRSSHGHQGHHLAYETPTGGGTLKRGMYHHHGNHILAIPDCVQPVPNAIIFEDGDDFQQERGGFDHNLSGGRGGSSMRLYMNQNAVVVGGSMLDISPPPEGPIIPRGVTLSPNIRRGSGGNTLLEGREGILLSQKPRNPIVPCSSSPSVSATNSTCSNPSPNSGTPTLVGVLKRNMTPNNPSTVKKRVQIQEISF
ncbi:neuroligin-1-like [Folsomia candida]|nr:neuroligin-1-like [Folsomia candida]